MYRDSWSLRFYASALAGAFFDFGGVFYGRIQQIYSRKTKNYTVNCVKLTDLSGNKLEQIPDSSFCVEVSITKNDNSKNADSIIVAMYDENGAFVDIRYMRGVYYQNQTIDFGVMINKTEKTIADIRCFVWNSISGLIPLSNTSGIIN